MTDPAHPDRLGRYEISNLLGAGGMGEVYRGRDTTLDREVAIKVLPAALADDTERLARLEREAKVLASLNHPQIGAIHSLEEADGVRFLVLELIEGDTLEDRLKSGPIDPDEALGFARQIAEALEVAHENGIVHRDLKPANVKVTPAGQVKVLDFGLAKSYESVPGASGSSPSVTQSPTMAAITGITGSTGVILGTAAYMSPEQARGKAIDKRADIWSFGCVLYEMLTGERPFSGDDVAETLATVIKEEPAWERLPAVPPEIGSLLRRCLRKDPKTRIRDVGDARIVIDEALTGQSESLVAGADADAARDSPAPWSARRAIAMTAGAIIVAAIAMTAGWSLRPVSTPVPLRKFDIPVENLETGIGPMMGISPDGENLMYVADDVIWVRDLAQLEPRALDGTDGAENPFWSPDGQNIGYVADGTLWRVPVSGGQPLAICDVPVTGRVVGATWSTRDVIILATWRGGLYEVPARGGAPEEILAIEEGVEIDFHSPSFLPNGRDLLIGAHVVDGTESSLELLSGSERVVLVAGGPGRTPVTPVYSPTGHILYSLGGSDAGVWALPFDAEQRIPTGEPFRIRSSATQLSVAGDGTLVYLSGRGGGDPAAELVWVDRQGQVVETLDRPRRHRSVPALSPDGHRVALVIEENDVTDLWVLDTDGGGIGRLTFDAASEGSPSWSPDGNRIFFHQPGGDAATEFYPVLGVIDVDGQRGKRTFFRGHGPVSTPDGGMLVYTVDDRGSPTLWTAAIDDDGTPRDPSPLVGDTDPSSAGAPVVVARPEMMEGRVSPDGRFLAYVSLDSGQPEVHLRRFPDGGGDWQVSVDGGRYPLWAAESGELFFMARRDSTPRMMGVQIGEGAAPRLSGLTELFAVTGDPELGFDVAPDGRRFLMGRQPEDPAGDTPSLAITVVQNWYEEFRPGR